MGPEKIRFKRDVNGRKVCKELIAKIEPRTTHIEPYAQKWLLYGVGKLDQSLVLLFEDFYIRTDNTVLQLQLAPANDTWVGFAIIKYQIACKGI